jgi:hypothetical protein
LKMIAQRWPTIITDFMKLGDGDVDGGKIKSKLGVSEAEGVVLATKNKLYNAWKETFRKTVEERYQRLLSMVQARKFSIDEYKTMLKPYIERYKAIREKGADVGGRTTLRNYGWLKAGAQATSLDWATIWAWKGMTRPDSTRITYEAFKTTMNILKSDLPPSLLEHVGARLSTSDEKKMLDKKFTDWTTAPNGIEPLDKWAWALYRYIEDHYTEKSGLPIRFSLEDLLKARNDFIGPGGMGSSPEYYYFKVFETDVERAILHLPDGTELEDMTWAPCYVYFDSYNMLFLRSLERIAQEKTLEAYIDQMLGETGKKKKISELSDDYEKLFKVYEDTKAGKENKTDKEKKQEHLAGLDLRAAREELQPQISRECSHMSWDKYKMFKSSTYEPRFDDVITGPYFTDVGGSTAKIWNFIKAKFDVPGFSSPGVN